MVSFVDSLFQPAAFPSADSISPILRSSCSSCQGRSSPHSLAGILFGSDQTGRELSFTPSKFSCQMRSGTLRPVTMMRAPPNAFEARLGTHATTRFADEISETGDEFSEVPESNPVLIVVDANKEINTNALDWALSYVVQKGDSVKLLGVVSHILNPMGYKSRADEKSWNGANKKVLDTAIAAHLAKFESIPNVYGRVEKIGAKLEIEVRAHVHSKHLVVDEAKRLNARYVVIDRHIKKDRKFYIENMNCYVTRVKSLTNFEHLRHGVPDSEQEIIEAGQDSPPVVPITPALAPRPQARPPVYQYVTPTMSQAQATQQQQYQWLPSPSSEFMTGTTAHPSDYHNSGYNESLPSASAFPEYIYHSGSTATTEYETYEDEAMRELALRRWLSDSSQIGGPALSFRMPELGHMAIGYPGDSIMHEPPPAPKPVMEEVSILAENMSNLCKYQGMRSSLPPVSARKPDLDRTQASYLIPGFKSSQSRHSQSTRQRDQATQVHIPESAAAELRSLTSEIPSRGGMPAGPGPISVQPRRAADASWALDLLGVGNPELQALEMQQDAFTVPMVRKSEQLRSSVPRGMSSQKQSPGTPPLCSLCGQKSPDFGKVKSFTFAELQNATNNFSGELFLPEGGYGSVYKGKLKEGQLVAIKQHKLASSQTDEEFVEEVEALGFAQHRNLVTLIGYCLEKNLRLLVYEYICNGSLDRHLSAKSKTHLEWKTRLKIALGSARALRYLHGECRMGCIIHRDMRPNNILLTHDFTPMVGDLGLARRQPSGDKEEETRILGTVGYLAPEYAETGKITDKADVYAFGVVLLELITGRTAIDHSRPIDQIFLTEWARPLLTSYDKQLVDPRLKTNYDEYEMHCMMHAANQCIKKNPGMRPRMVQVLRILDPSQESDWGLSRGKNASLMVPRDGNQSEELSSCQVSSRGSQGGSCSASEEASYSDLSDTDSLPRHPFQPSRKSSRAKPGGKSLWKSFTRDKLYRDDSSRDIAAVNRMSVDDISYSGMP